MAWIRQNLTGEGVVTTTDTWLIHRLCGAFVTDSSTASRSLLLDLDAAAWYAETARCSASRPSAARVVDCDHVAGETDALGQRLPVTGLIVDQQAALLAESCLEPGLRPSARSAPARSCWPRRASAPRDRIRG